MCFNGKTTGTSSILNKLITQLKPAPTYTPAPSNLPSGIAKGVIGTAPSPVQSDGAAQAQVVLSGSGSAPTGSADDPTGVLRKNSRSAFNIPRAAGINI